MDLVLVGNDILYVSPSVDRLDGAYNEIRFPFWLALLLGRFYLCRNALSLAAPLHFRCIGFSSIDVCPTGQPHLTGTHTQLSNTTYTAHTAQTHTQRSVLAPSHPSQSATSSQRHGRALLLIITVRLPFNHRPHRSTSSCLSKPESQQPAAATTTTTTCRGQWMVVASGRRSAHTKRTRSGILPSTPHSPARELC